MTGRHVPVFFSPEITLFEVMRAAHAIGCVVVGDQNQLVIRKRQAGDLVGARGVVLDKLPEIPSEHDLVRDETGIVAGSAGARFSEPLDEDQFL